jgi:hypothetical protein
MRFSPDTRMLTPNQTYEFGSTQLHILGTRGIDRLGRVYRYVKAGASDLVAGNCVQGPAIVANHLANTPPAVALGATSFSYTPGATAGAASLYKDGLMQVDTTPGNGYMYGVADHLAITSATAFTLNLHPDDAVAVALTTSSRVGLHQNPYKGVVQFPVTTATSILVGVAVSAITAAYFGWIQTWGPAAVLINGTPALGATVVSPSASTAGSVDVITTTNLVTAQIVGTMMQVGVSGKNNAVFLRISQ